MADTAEIVIVGAGIAGLSAAEYLTHHGFTHITILEASQRVGGRMYTAEFGQRGEDIVELGANWIHGGCNANSVMVLANQHDLLKNSVLLDRIEGYFHRSDGRVVEQSVVRKVWEKCYAWMDEADGKRYPEGHRPSWEAYLRSCLEENMTYFPESEREDVRCVFNCLLNFARFHSGGFLNDSYVDDKDSIYLYLPGGNVKVPRGMSAIVQAICKNLTPGCVKLGREVQTIEWQGSKVTVSCSNQEQYRADHVIVTTSLGYLKKHQRSLFSPQLPPAKVEAINTVSFGKVDKIFLQWDKPFWSRGEGSIKLAWTDEDAVVRNVDEWYKKIFAFDEVFNNPNVLVAWISGDEAEHMEQLPQEEIAEKCAWVIRRFLRNPAIPKPSRVLRSKWCSDPFVLGSYSYPNKAVCERPEYFDNMAEPLYDDGMPRVLFAGEATIGWSHSTMHGGRSSGLREGERLALLYKVIPPSNL